VPLTPKSPVGDLRQFLSTGWNDDIDRLFLTSDDPWHRSAAYAIGFLT
jgi:hypothetical protein